MNLLAMWAIFKRDFKSYFGSLTGYLFVVVFLLLTFVFAFRPDGDGKFFTKFGPNDEGLLISNNAGHVRVEDATFLGGLGRNYVGTGGNAPPD